MFACPDCDFTTKTARGLSSHRRQKHLESLGGVNRRALEKTLAVLKAQGWFEDVDAANLQMLRSLADQVDRDAGNAQMWGKYGDALERLMRANDDADSSLEAALAAIRSAGPVGDTPPS